MPTHSASAFSKSQLCVTGPAAVSGWSHCHLCHKGVLSSEPARLTSPSLTIYLGVWHVLGCFWYGRAGSVSSQRITSAPAGLQLPGWGKFLHEATGCFVWDYGDALRGSGRWKAGSSRGRAVQPAASRLCSCSPQHWEARQGKARAGHRAPAAPPPLAPALSLSLRGAAPSQSQLCLQLVKAPFPSRAATSAPAPASPLLPSPSQPSQRLRTRGEQERPRPSRMKEAGPWPCSGQGLCCATEEGCAGWGHLLSQ